MKVSRDDIQRAVQQLGLSGRAVCVHSSLRSFGRVNGGADAVVDAFLAEGSTLIVPSFTWALSVPPPPHLRYRRNGWNYERDIALTTGIGRIFTPATLEIEKEMGAVAAAVVARPGRARGNHPLCSFSAIGPLAERIVENQLPDDVFAPLQALAESGGYVVLMGLDLRRLTLIHLAEKLSGRTLLRRWANDATGRILAMEVGGHSRGFETLRPYLPCLKTCQVGASRWTFAPAQSVLDQAVEALRRDPALTHCEYPDCQPCNDIAAGGPILDSCAS
jgi:aminoglycoside N3'-acetyltransferase